VTDAGLDPAFVRAELRRFLAEDIGSGDITTAWTVPAGKTAGAWIVAREACVVAGLPVAAAVFTELDAGVVAEAQDIDLCMLLGAGWPSHLGGITPYLDRVGVSERVTGQRFLPRGVASLL